MKALTVSSEGSRVLKLGIGGGAFLDLGEVFCWATANEVSKLTSEQKNKNKERRMTSFLKPDSCSGSRILTRRFWRQSESGGRSRKLSEKFSIPARPVGVCIRHDPPSGSLSAPAPDHSHDRRRSARRCASPRRILPG